MGSELETRRNDRNFLFQLYKIENGGCIEDAIANMQALMEPEDVKLVKHEFAEWEKKKKVRA